jgi:copper(I)-binding protein
MNFRPLALACALLLPALPAWADPLISLDHGGVWQTLKPGQNTQGFLQIHNTGDAPDTLTGADCTIADSTTLVDAKGNPLPGLEIPPGRTVVLSSDGPHLLIEGARYRVQKNGILPCSINFAQSGDLIGYLNVIAAPKT